MPPQWKQKIRLLMLDLDARIDSTLFSSGKGLRELYERYSTFMDRFYVGRWKRWVFIEPFSEAATIGLGGLVMMLALAIPAFRETSDEDWLKKSDLAVQFLDRYGNPIGSRGIKHNDSIPLEDFPDNLIKATLATEDRRFYDHFGIDMAGTFRALLTNAQAGGVRQGGSSITQQLAKNLFLNNERTIERKVKEAFLAIWLETRLTKNEILKLYLDRAYMGGGAFGVDAAAQYYFNKSAREVNLAEAAMLAGLFKAPSRFAPHINLPAARARANVVLDNLVEAGFMTEGQVFGARRNPATAVDRRDERSPNYYLDWAFDEMKKLADTLPKSVHERVFVVRLALDVDLQKRSEQAISRSINVIPVKLAIALGNGNPKIGRAESRETARKAGIRTPLPDTPSMPIGADEVTVLDHTGGYSMFPNLGKAMTPHAVLEVRSGAGELIWRWDRDGKKPVQVITPQVAMDMNMMMSKVVEEGTARRAILDGIKSAGKTGTTNAYRDAWFVGFTGNMVCGIWFGNDDYTVMNQMTGGSLPAQTWHDIMAYAHQGIELMPIPGLGPQATGRQVAAADNREGNKKDNEPTPPRVSSILTKRGADTLLRVERLMDEATRALATSAGPSKATDAQGAMPAPQRQDTLA